MNNFDERTAISEEQLDRLVDGALSEVERRELLGQLEQRPDGWRRCAAAFLEAQAWREALGQHVATLPPALVQLPSPSPSAAWQWKHVLAIAASFLLAFSSVLWLRNGGNNTSNLTPTDIAKTTPLPSNHSTADPGTGPTQVADNNPAGPQTVRLVVDRGANGQPEFVDVPVIGDPQQVDRVLNDHSLLLPPSVAQALKRMGHEVHQQRELWPVQTSDGKQIVVPVDQVEVRYVGSRGVQ